MVTLCVQAVRAFGDALRETSSTANSPDLGLPVLSRKLSETPKAVPPRDGLYDHQALGSFGA